ncbi:hypothetical protein [Dethiobacter alkaliphilus]|uniref:ATP-grasp domain-containing protein n=1 Tax=Dethiobacter alkaliphilus AHT 1 TaxID=555088 RepID=C0GHS1_DETAL|nr:hypothetical protein [Dethiobacter alkaliphilus]EEG76995.1 hypothetical protein DealDRAFT_2030 [Dethiobacter alkaliphilus AHT 1]
MQNVCIAVHDSMLAAALAVPSQLQPLSPQDTLQAQHERYQAGNKNLYPAWYLFGCKEKNVEGLVSAYTRQGAKVFLCPESKLSVLLDMDIVDTQFCSVSDDLYNKLASRNIKVIGFLPETFSSKAALAQLLAQNGGETFLPIQKSYHRDSQPLLPQSSGTAWIVKTPYGSAGKNSTGEPYTVWDDTLLRQKLPSLVQDLKHHQQIICSEFITTCDPYAADADHVVHKLHFLGKEPHAGVEPYGTTCQRFIHRCNWQLLQARKIMPLPDFIGEPEITVGNIESVDSLSHFIKTLDFHRGRIMLSVDFMIPTDGKPRYLESNKLAATFAERFDPGLPPIIDTYGNLPL